MTLSVRQTRRQTRRQIYENAENLVNTGKFKQTRRQTRRQICENMQKAL